MHKKFKINWTKIKGSCQLGRKVVTHDSKSDLPLYLVKFTYILKTFFMSFKDMVTIDDFEAKDVISMIKFAYKEELPKFCYNAELARLADKYDYQSLFNRCIANLCKNIHRKNVFSHLFNTVFLISLTYF